MAFWPVGALARAGAAAPRQSVPRSSPKQRASVTFDAGAQPFEQATCTHHTGQRAHLQLRLCCIGASLQAGLTSGARGASPPRAASQRCYLHNAAIPQMISGRVWSCSWERGRLGAKVRRAPTPLLRTTTEQSQRSRTGPSSRQPRDALINVVHKLWWH